MVNALPKTQVLDADAEALLERTLAECEQAAGRVKDLLRLADALISVLPPDRRISYARHIALFHAFFRPMRATGVNDNILTVIGEAKQHLTATEVREALADKGLPVDQKQVNNALDYLARRGELERIARGQYRISQRPLGPASADEAIDDMITEQFGAPTYRGLPPGMKSEPPCY